MKKPVAKYWTTASVARMEPHIDSVVAFFAKQLSDRFAASAGEEKMGEAFDFGQWCMFCASVPHASLATRSSCIVLLVPLALAPVEPQKT